MKKILVFAVVVLAALAAAAFQLNRHREKQQAEVQQELIRPTLRVEAARVTTKEVSESIQTSGTTEAFETVELIAETDGRVKELTLATGKTVQKGQLILRTDQELRQIQHNLSQLQYEKAKRDFERLDVLYRQKNVAEIEWENARFQMQQTEGQWRQAAKLLSQTTMTAPVSGVVIEKKVSEGSMLQPGTPVATLAVTSPLLVKTYLTEAEVVQVRTGDRVRIVADVLAGQSFGGTIRAIIPRATATKSFPVEIVVEASQTAGLLPGMSVQVFAREQKRRRILALPRTALLNGQTTQPAVLCIKADRQTEIRRIRLGQSYGQDLEVLEGLAEQDIVVTGGQQQVEPGIPVEYQLP